MLSKVQWSMTGILTLKFQKEYSSHPVEIENHFQFLVLVSGLPKAKNYEPVFKIFRPNDSDPADHDSDDSGSTQ